MRIVSAGVNLILNLIMVRFWGVYGILLSTVISMVGVGMPWLLVNLFTTIFEKKMMKEYLKKMLGYILVSTIVAVISTILCQIVGFQGIVAVVINTLICGILTVLAFVLVYRKSDEFQRSLNIINRITGDKLKFVKVLEK